MPMMTWCVQTPELKATVQIPNGRLNLSLFTSGLLCTFYLHLNDGGVYFVTYENLLSDYCSKATSKAKELTALLDAKVLYYYWLAGSLF